MNKRTQVKNTFTISGPDAKKDYVHEYIELVDASTFGQPNVWEEGLTFFIRDSDQAKLNRISDYEYEVVSTGERIITQ